MLHKSLLVSVRACLFGSDRRSVRPRRRTKAVRSLLNLETLEDRLVPTGGASATIVNGNTLLIQDNTSNVNAVVSNFANGQIQVQLSGDTFSNVSDGIAGKLTNKVSFSESFVNGLTIAMNGEISVAPGTSLTLPGAISLTGAAKTTTNNVGVYLNGAALNASSVTLTGSQYGDSASSLSSNNNDGVLISGSRLTAGSINITGDGEGVGSNEDGVVINRGSTVTVTGTGGITINGYGAWGGQNSNVGVYVTDQGTVLGTSTGTLNVQGNGGGHGSYNYGINVQNGAQLQTHGGLLEVGGQSFKSSTGSSNHGLYLSGAKLNTGGGEVMMTGLNFSPSSWSSGIYMDSSSVNSGSGQVLMYGVGDYASGGTHVGIDMWNSSVTSSSNINLVGNGRGAYGYGIYLADSSVQSNGTAQLMGGGTGTSYGEGVGMYDGSEVTAYAGGGSIYGYGSYWGDRIDDSQVWVTTGQLSITGTGSGVMGHGGGMDISGGSFVYNWAGELLLSGAGVDTGVEVDAGSTVWSPSNRVIVLSTASNGPSINVAPYTVFGNTVAQLGLQDADIFYTLQWDLMRDGVLTNSDTLGVFDAAVVNNDVSPQALNDLATITQWASPLGMSSTVQKEAQSALSDLEWLAEVVFHFAPSSAYQMFINWDFHVM